MRHSRCLPCIAPFLALFIILPAAPLHADVKLPAIFGSHMVLQKDAKVPIWGWADPAEQITITAADSKTTATAGPDGKWSAHLDPLKQSDQPIEVTITAKNTITFQDVLIGDVWVCSGQSNMEFPLSRAHNATEEIPIANHPGIRLLLLQKKVAFEPQSDCKGEWAVCSPRSAANFSAVGYFFARDLRQSQQTPIGMIATYWGGTGAESWISLPALKANPLLANYATRFEQMKDNLPQLKDRYTTQTLPAWQKNHDLWDQQVAPAYKEAMDQYAKDSQQAKDLGQPAPRAPRPSRPEPVRPGAPDNDPHIPTVLSNGMIDPIVPFAVKGMIWYQGENNAGKAVEYRTLFPAMITDWRTRWAQGDFPFIWVQLANYMARQPDPTQKPDGWAGLREAQSMTLKLPHTGQAVIIDIGQGNDIHPRDKIDVGHRLALSARHVAYGQDLVYSGPTYDSMKIEGSSIRLTFKNTGTGLHIAAAPSTQPDVPQEQPASALQGFAIAGSDRMFVWADAKIQGNDIIVSSPQVHSPVAVRYAWADNPAANLYNKEGLPASPFRTDDWSDAPAPGGVPRDPNP